MPAVENAVKARQMYACIEKGDWGGVEQLLHPEFVFFSNIDEPHHGFDEFYRMEKKNFDACSSFKISILETISERESVGVFLILEGAVDKQLLGIEAPGAAFRFSAFNLLRFDGGLIIENRVHWDRSLLLRQIEQFDKSVAL